MNLRAVAQHLQHPPHQVTFIARGQSMTPRIRDGDEVTVYRIDRADLIAPGTVVLAKVRGRYLLHRVLTTDTSRKRVLIGNNHGKVNGWAAYRNVKGIVADKR